MTAGHLPPTTYKGDTIASDACRPPPRTVRRHRLAAEPHARPGHALHRWPDTVAGETGRVAVGARHRLRLGDSYARRGVRVVRHPRDVSDGVHHRQARWGRVSDVPGRPDAAGSIRGADRRA